MKSWVWRERMYWDLVVAELAERTREAYLRSVQMLSLYFNGSTSAQLTEQQFNGDLR